MVSFTASLGSRLLLQHGLGEGIFQAATVKARYFRTIRVSTITAPTPLNSTCNDFETPLRQPKWQALWQLWFCYRLLHACRFLGWKRPGGRREPASGHVMVEHV